jgi:predicted RNase H-like HicB family nuclease
MESQPTRYSVVISWSDEDAVFIAQVPELPGCVAHGDTREEALSNVQDAMDLWLGVARKRGREIPKPTGRRVAA